MQKQTELQGQSGASFPGSPDGQPPGGLADAAASRNSPSAGESPTSADQRLLMEWTELLTRYVGFHTATPKQTYGSRCDSVATMAHGKHSACQGTRLIHHSITLSLVEKEAVPLSDETQQYMCNEAPPVCCS